MNNLTRNKTALGFAAVGAVLVFAVIGVGAAFALLSDGDSSNDSSSSNANEKASEVKDLLADVSGSDTPSSGPQGEPPAPSDLGSHLMKGAAGEEAALSYSTSASLPYHYTGVNCNGNYLIASARIEPMPQVFSAQNIVNPGGHSQFVYFRLQLWTFLQQRGWVKSGAPTGWQGQWAYNQSFLSPTGDQPAPQMNFPSQGYYAVSVEYYWQADATHAAMYAPAEWASQYKAPYDASWFLTNVPYCTY
jgi:hypothetical protein